MTTPSVVAGQKPSRVRYWVIFFAVTLAIVTYIDRVCISFAAPIMSHELGLDTLQMGAALSAFAWAYALFEIPGGFLGDWMGPRRVLMRIVLWWSFFTAATGWVWNLPSLVITRFLFGAGEAGCFPNLTKAFTVWLPPNERVRAQGIMWLSARWGGAFTPPLVNAVFVLMTWRHGFELFGGIGIIWAIFFYRWFRDNPMDNPKLNQAERDLVRESAALGQTHGKVPWAKFFASRQVWMLCLQYFCLSYGWYFYITWLPTYLRQGRHLELAASAWLSVLPLFFGGLGSFVSSMIATPLSRLTGSVSRTRRLMAYMGFTGASGFLILSTLMPDPLFAMLSMGMASFCNDLVMPGAWGAAMDVGGRHAGTLSGTMNMAGNIGGAMSPLIIGYLLKQTANNWDLTFYVSAGVYVMGSLFWFFLDPVTPLEPAEVAVH